MDKASDTALFGVPQDAGVVVQESPQRMALDWRWMALESRSGLKEILVTMGTVRPPDRVDQLGGGYTSISILAGSWIASLIRTRKLTASRPSTMRWS